MRARDPSGLLVFLSEGIESSEGIDRVYLKREMHLHRTLPSALLDTLLETLSERHSRRDTLGETLLARRSWRGTLGETLLSL